MKIEFDETKNLINIEKHGFPLSAFSLLDMESAVFHEDNRKEYGEKRIRVYAFLLGRLCTSAFTIRNDVFRVINFRKANLKEMKKYERER